MTKSFKQDNKPLRVVSVSLGSSTRNKKVVLELLNREIIVERIGVDANLKKAIELIKELDGKVDAFGLGGINLFLSFYGKKYKIRDANLIAKAAKKTPIVDGYGLKKYIEPKIIKELHETRIVDFAHKNILMVSALDREATAEVIYNMETNDLYGDLVFSVGFPYVLSKKDNIELLNFLARLFLPLFCKIPFSYLYPLGRKQEESINKYSHLFKWADIIVGDFHYIKRHSPNNLKGKIIITSTTTEQDIELMRKRGVEIFVTTTPSFNGRTFGTNVMEALIVALAGKKPEEMTEDDYLEYIKKLNWTPHILRLQETQGKQLINV